MNVGIGQTGGTCWFNSSLNIFLTSDAGVKILWKKLRAVYARLGPANKNKFNSNITIPCSYKNPAKAPSIYFWKFLNQYICAVGGPGGLLPRSGLNAYLMKNVKWKNAGLLESKENSGGWPSIELEVILKHLGFQQGKDFRIRHEDPWRYKFKNIKWSNPIMIFRGGPFLNYYRGIPFRDLSLNKQGYDLTGAIVYVRPTDESGRDPHVWSCSIRNGKGYITDSNYSTRPVECTWWLKDSLLKYFDSIDVNFRPNKARQMVFDVILYTNKSYTDAISPFCLLPKKGYRPLTKNNETKMKQFQQWGPAGVNFLKTGRVGVAHERFTPRILAESIRKNSARVLLNANALQSIVNEASSFNHGMSLLNSMVRYKGFKVNKGGPNFRNFRQKLLTKFPVPVRQNMLRAIWSRSSSNTEFAKRLRNYANRSGFTVNENQIKGILAARAKTRAGVKRVKNAETERMYLVNTPDGRRWFNSNGANVNNINTGNWVQTTNNNVANNIMSYVNGTNVKTFKRRVSNFNSNRAKRARHI
jgi:hypothetical protein